VKLVAIGIDQRYQTFATYQCRTMQEACQPISCGQQAFQCSRIRAAPKMRPFNMIAVYEIILAILDLQWQDHAVLLTPAFNCCVFLNSRPRPEQICPLR
jgi:hypothetical protein